MRPYPWSSERKRFNDQQNLSKALRRIVGTPLLIVGTLLCPPTILVLLWSYAGFRRTNDSWWKRGGIAAAVGVLLCVTTFRFRDWAAAWNVALKSFGTMATTEPGPSVMYALWLGLGPALVCVGVASVIADFYVEYHAMRFLYPTRKTWTARIRARINTTRLRTGRKIAAGFIPFGLIAGDPIPWRTRRYGRIVERPMANLGHGCIAGTNGSGKTVAAMNMAHHVVTAGAAVFYLDFKASLTTQQTLRAIAEERGVPFLSFDLGIKSSETTWYDPLNWDGKPSEKASLLIESFSFSSTGGAEFFKGVAEQWLPLQLEVMDAVGVRDGESKFDFLVATCNPSGLRERISHLSGGTDGQRAQVQAWKERMGDTKAEHLTSLRNNLVKVVNSAGHRLRPDVPGDAPLSFEQAAADGAIVYFGIGVSDTTALKTLGSLAIRDITTLSAKRQRTPDLKTLRPVVTLCDEASRLAERAVVMNELFATAREAAIWIWPITQSLSSYPEAVVREIRTNAWTWVVYRLQDPDTAAMVTSSLGEIPVETEMVETNVTHHFLRAAETTGSGESRVTLARRAHLPADEVLKTPDRYCYVWFTGNWSRATRRKVRNRRIKGDEIAFDAPLVRTVALDIVLDPPKPQQHGRTIAEMMPSAEDFFTPTPPEEASPVPAVPGTPGGQWTDPGTPPAPQRQQPAPQPRPSTPPPQQQPAPQSAPVRASGTPTMWDPSARPEIDDSLPLAERRARRKAARAGTPFPEQQQPSTNTAPQPGGGDGQAPVEQDRAAGPGGGRVPPTPPAGHDGSGDSSLGQWG